jgi:predicted enzyme related to lactoylglutathione lyase
MQDRPMDRRRPVLRAIDAVTVPVPTLEQGLAFYRDRLGHVVVWRDDAAGQAGLALPGSDAELVLTTAHAYEPDWLVDSVDAAVTAFDCAGGSVSVPPTDIPVGRLAVVVDPFGNPLVLVDLSKGRYVTDASARVIGVAPPDASVDAAVDRSGADDPDRAPA